MALDWTAQLVRLSVFSAASISLSDSDWQAVTGRSESDNRISIPGGGRAFTGPFQQGQLAISYVGTRADFIFTPAEGQGGIAPELGSIDEVVPVFVDATKKWLETNESQINRLAFGGVFWSEASSQKDAYSKLSGLLKSVSISAGMSDLLFRSNWPRKSSVIDGLTINRLTTWSAVKAALGTLQFTGAQVSVSSAVEKLSVQMEIDHNTDQEHTGPFTKSELLPIYDELVHLAFENAALGECK